MRPLVAKRRTAPYDPRFALRRPLLWPLARAVAALGHFDDFPPVEALTRVFASAAPPVRFVPLAPRKRRGCEPDPTSLYDARVTVDRTVPTRARCWHDLMNALVWGTFPSAKLALHARQHQAILHACNTDDGRMPARRTRELDTLALIDEGGLVVLSGDPTTARHLVERGQTCALRAEMMSGAIIAVVFGHAIYESLVLDAGSAAAAVFLPAPAALGDITRAVDEALAGALAARETFGSPNELVRVNVQDMLPPPPGVCSR